MAISRASNSTIANGFPKYQNLSAGITPIVTSGLIMHLDASNASSYPGSGTSWFDLSGNSKTVALNNTSYVSTDGGGISFNGTNSYGTFNSSGFTTSYTIEAMVNLTQYNSDGSTSSDVMMLTNSSNTHGILLEVDAGPRWRNVHRFPYGTSPDDELLTANGSVTNNTKYHLMVVRNGSTSQTLYVNGVSVATKTPVNGGFDTNLTLGTLGRLSQSTASRHWYGLMHQVRIYDRALSTQEVTQNYNAIKGKFGI
jgi:hypothetical protein